MNAKPAVTLTPKTLTSSSDLIAAGLIPAAREAEIAAVAKRYAIAIPPALAALIDRADPDDPIARQFVPSITELHVTPDERADPIGDKAHAPIEGIVHRYPDRVLLQLLHVCPVYCRFCFRREVIGPAGDGTLSQAALLAALGYIADHPEIWEVILTGGDPLFLSPRRIAAVTAALDALPHVKIIRWHTRLPIAAPDRVTPELVAALQATATTTYVALHANHAREFSPDARAAIARLADAGIPLVSQSVLLKGVNDDPTTLSALMRAFVENRVKPYYLHHGDLAPGTSHFRTTIAEGQALMASLRGRLSGLCQPTYVLDLPGGHDKIPLADVSVSEERGGPDGHPRYRLTDFRGESHIYPPMRDQPTER